MELPSFYSQAARIVQAGLNEKLPRGWEKICVLGGKEVLKESQGKKDYATCAAQCIVENKKAYVLVNVDSEANGKILNLSSAAIAVRLLTHEIAGHAIGVLRALSRKEDPGSEETDHLCMIRLIDGSEGENSYLAAIRKVLPHVKVQGFPGLRDEILKEYPQLSGVPDVVLDNMLKRFYLESCVEDIELQVINHAGSDDDMDSDEPHPAVLERCDKLVEPMRKAEDNPDHPLWTTPAGPGH